MKRTTFIIGILLFELALCGCTSSPWSSEKKIVSPQTPPTPEKPIATVPPQPTLTNQNPQAPAANAQANSQSMQQIMEELRQLGTLDPAAQNKLMEDLKQTDPALWPLVMQQFRAAIAYKRRAAERETVAANQNPTINANIASTGNSLTPNTITNVSLNAIQPVNNISRLPATPEAQAAPQSTPKENFQSATKIATVPKETKPDIGERPSKDTANVVVNASYNAPISQEPGDWKEDLSAAIKSMEASTQSNPKSADDIAQQARLRMLYALAGRRDDALKPIASAKPEMQEFWSKEIYGLTTLLDSEKTPDLTRRTAESKQILNEAITRLGEAAPLTIRNLNFCTAIQSYGCFTPFKKYDFNADQEALLYAEMDNFASESTPKGFHTQLKSSYQILDSTGQRVAEHTFTTTEEYCQNARRDFFIGYHLRMPKRLNPGKYTLQLTVEDLKSQKVGQSTIEFTIKDGEK